MALGRGPDFHRTVLRRRGDQCLGLNISLMHRLGAKLSLDDDIGVGEPFFQVATFSRNHTEYIGGFFRLRFNPMGKLMIMQNG